MPKNAQPNATHVSRDGSATTCGHLTRCGNGRLRHQSLCTSNGAWTPDDAPSLSRTGGCLPAELVCEIPPTARTQGRIRGDQHAADPAVSAPSAAGQCHRRTATICQRAHARTWTVIASPSGAAGRAADRPRLRSQATGSASWPNSRPLSGVFLRPCLGRHRRSVPINTRLAPPEIVFWLTDSGCTGLLIDDTFAPMLPTILPQTPDLRQHHPSRRSDATPDVQLSYEALIADAQPRGCRPARPGTRRHLLYRRHHRAIRRA